MNELTPEQQAEHERLLAEAASYGVDPEGLNDHDLAEKLAEEKLMHEEIVEQAAALGIDSTSLSPKELSDAVDKREEELGIDFSQLDHEQIMSAIAEKLQATPEDPTQPLPAGEPTNGPDYNCSNCGGLGLVENDTKICPVCSGKGKVT